MSRRLSTPYNWRGTSDKLDAFLATLREVAKIVEVARSGVVGLSRGDKIMR